MALTPALVTSGTNIQQSPGAPVVIKGSFLCGTSAVMNTVPGLADRTDYTVIPFTPTAGTMITQGGSLANPSSNALAATDFFYMDAQGSLYLCTTSATVAASYSQGTTYTLNLIPQYL